MSTLNEFRTRIARFEDYRGYEEFRMPAAHERCCVLRRPAYENLQGRKPREAMRGRGSFRYGDLIAAADDGDGGGDEPACWPRAMRAMSKRGSASNDEYWRSV